MIELWVKPSGLRVGHDPDNPKLEDVRYSFDLVRLAHRVVLQTEHAAFVRKDGDGGEGWGLEPGQSLRWTRVEFDPDAPTMLKPVVPVEDEMKMKAMRKSLQLAIVRKSKG